MSKYKKIAFVIAHHHPEGKLLNHFFDHVRYLRLLSDDIIIVSTMLNKAGNKKLKPYANIIVRKNKGYDFFSYKIGLHLVKNIKDIDHLVFFNSSFLTVEPKKLYQKYLSEISKDGFYGITSCSAPQYHIQSYFFSFAGKSIMQSKVFWDWWAILSPIDKRETVIQKYEVGMTQWFMKKGVFVKSIYRPNIFSSFVIAYRYIRLMNLNISSILSKMRGYFKKENSSIFYLANTLNLTHFLYDDIFKVFSIVKIDLLTKNPTKQNLEYFIRRLNKKKNKLDGIKLLI